MRMDTQRPWKWLRRMAIAALLLHFSTVSANPFVPTGWLQRAAEQAPVAADKQAVDHFSRVEVIGANELGKMRGGLRVGGLDIDVGAVVRTIIDGNLALESHISLHNANQIAAAIRADSSSVANAPPRSEAVSVGEVTTPANTAVGNGAGAAPASIQAPNVVSSVVLNDAKGLTQVIHDVTRNRIVTAIVNEANLRDIRHRIDIDVTVSNFRAFQRAAANQRVSRSMARGGR